MDQGNLDTSTQPTTSRWLPPGFRFHPTDEELISYYLVRKIADCRFRDDSISEVDLNKHEPWELPGKAQMMGDREWYFFSVKDKKYPSGSRTNRATRAGYWKATGKDKEVFLKSTKHTYGDQRHTDVPMGMKKTLVFYEGRAPKGSKSNWIMHEYRLHDQRAYIASNNRQFGRKFGTKAEMWVLCRVFYKKKLPQLMPQLCSPLQSSKRKIYSSVEVDATSHETKLSRAATRYDNLSNYNMVDNDGLPPSCNEHKEASTTTDHVDSGEDVNLVASHEDLEEMQTTLPTTSSNYVERGHPSQQLNTMFSEELDTLFQSTPFHALPRFPSELESLWFHNSSFFA